MVPKSTPCTSQELLPGLLIPLDGPSPDARAGEGLRFCVKTLECDSFRRRALQGGSFSDRPSARLKPASTNSPNLANPSWEIQGHCPTNFSASGRPIE